MIAKQIQEILNKLHEILRGAQGPRTRREYMESKGFTGRDWHFSLTADEIIKNKIPGNVIGSQVVQDYSVNWRGIRCRVSQFVPHMNPIGTTRVMVKNTQSAVIK